MYGRVKTWSFNPMTSNHAVLGATCLQNTAAFNLKNLAFVEEGCRSIMYTLLLAWIACKLLFSSKFQLSYRSGIFFTSEYPSFDVEIFWPVWELGWPPGLRRSVKSSCDLTSGKREAVLNVTNRSAVMTFDLLKVVFCCRSWVPHCCR